MWTVRLHSPASAHRRSRGSCGMADAAPPTVDAPAPARSAPTLNFATPAAPAVRGDGAGLPEGAQWRYSEFIDAVQGGKVERVRFSKDGSQLQAGGDRGHCEWKGV